MIDEQTSKSFVARFWLEKAENGDARWRGHIRHVQSEEQQYFGNLEVLSEFLGRISGMSGFPITSEEVGQTSDSGGSS